MNFKKWLSILIIIIYASINNVEGIAENEVIVGTNIQEKVTKHSIVKIKAGKYNIENPIFVPSNRKIILEDGVELIKINPTKTLNQIIGKDTTAIVGANNELVTQSIFVLANYSAIKDGKQNIGNYDSSKNVEIIAENEEIGNKKIP